MPPKRFKFMTAVNKIIYSMSGVGKVYPPKKQIIKDISLSYFYGAKIGVIGANGSGKSTLLKIMAGVDKEYVGEISLSKGYSVGYLEQEPQLEDDKTVKQVVEEGVQEVVDLLKEFEDISAAFATISGDDEMNQLLEKQAKIQDKLDACNAWDLESRLELAMDSLRCPPSDQKIKTLSGGEKRRVALCKLLLKEPDILLLDEPTNHLDAETVFWLEKHLQEYKGTVILITHDRYFLDNVTNWILELEGGEGIPFAGNYSSWLEQKNKRLKQKEKTESKRQKALADELNWIRSSQKARQAKGKARINNYNAMLNDQKEKAKKVTTELYIPPGPRLGDSVIEADNITKGFDDKLLYENLSFKLPPGGIVGIIGPNGAGKTTLFKMIMGMEKVDGGTFKKGETVVLSYVDQNRDFDGEKTIYDVVAEGNEFIKLGTQEVNSRAYIGKFNFSGDEHHKKMKTLSGGERNRVQLACLLKSEGNVLLLDEPTNDLDIHTLRSLEEALQDFAGCAVIISHDRYFLDRLATHILAFEGNGQAVWFEGNFSDYEADKVRRLGEDSLMPKRIQYKKLTRD